jgi:xylulokinase
MALLGVDLGSGSCKIAVFQEDGTVLARTVSAYTPPISPGKDMLEIHSDGFFDAFVSAINKIAPDIRGKIEAMAISSHGESYIALDGTGKPLGNFIMNADNRAVEESSLLEKELGREYLYSICGVPPHPTFSLNKIAWHKRRKLYEKAAHYLNVGDYILYRLNLGLLTDYSLASRVMGFDIRKKRWSEQITGAAGVHEKQFPETAPAGTPAGKLSIDMAALLGLRQGISVCVGGHDQPCGLLGSGILSGEDAMVSAGTYECAALSSAFPCNTPEALKYHLNSYCHVVPEKYITLAFFPGAMIVDWLVREFCLPEAAAAEEKNVSPYQLLDSMIETIPGPTGVCITPHLIGSFNPDWDVRATAVFAGLGPKTTRLHLYKAVYEGIACELARNIRILEKITGTIFRLRISGGNAALQLSVLLRAAFTGKPFVRLQSCECVCLGAAMLAGAGSGVFRNLSEAVEGMVHLGETVVPDPDIKSMYEIQCRQYDVLFPALHEYRALLK